MAFMEGKLQGINFADLLALSQQNRQTQEDEQRKKLQNQLLKQQMEAQKWNLQKDKDAASASVIPDKTTGMLTGEFGNFLNTRQPLSQMPGYVTGTNPETYQAQQFALRQALASGGGHGGGGGQTQEEANLLNQQANLAEEQARNAQYKRQGYGSATAERMADLLANAKMQGSNDKQYDDMIGGLRNKSKQRWEDINAGDKTISNTKSIGNEMANEIKATQGKEAAAETKATAEIRKYQKELYNSPEWKGKDNKGTEIKVDQKAKNEMLEKLPGFVSAAISAGTEPDIASFIAGILRNYNKSEK